MPPTFANGKICYIEMPATDIARSANFYRQVFGWNIRKRDNGSTAFDHHGRGERHMDSGASAGRDAGAAFLHHGGQRGRND